MKLFLKIQPHTMKNPFDVYRQSKRKNILHLKHCVITFVKSIIVFSAICTNAYAVKPSFDFISVEYAQRNIQDIGLEAYILNATKDITFSGISLVGSTEFNEDWFGEFRYLSVASDRIVLTNVTQSANDFIPAPSGATTGTTITYTEPEVQIVSTSIGYQLHQSDSSNLFIAIGLLLSEFEATMYDEVIFRDSSGDVVPSSAWEPFTHTNNISDPGVLFTLNTGFRVIILNAIEIGFRLEATPSDSKQSSYDVDLLYNISNNYALKFGFELADGASQYSLGLRYSH